MKRLGPPTVLLMAALLLLVPLAGCQNAAEKAVEKATGVEVDKNGNSVTVTGEDGTVKVEGGDQASLPEEFPKDVPIYPGAKLVVSSSATADGKTTFTAAYETEDDVKTVHGWYKKQLPKEGWTVQGETLTGTGTQSTGAIMTNKGESQLTVAATRSQDNKKTTITLNVSE